MTELLQVEHLSKQYPGFTLQDISFSVKPGRIMGLIGKNGGLNFRNCHTSIVPAIRLARRSEIGMLYQTPAAPKKRGKINRQGSNSLGIKKS